jgi:hypothetical protein
MMATDLAEEPKEEAPRKPPQKPAPYAPVAGQAAEIVALRTELAVVKAQASKDLLGMQEERDKARATAASWCKQYYELERVTIERAATYDPKEARYLLGEDLVQQVLGELLRCRDRHPKTAQACKRLENALIGAAHGPLPPALPDMREGESLDGFVFGGPAHGERWKCTGRVMTLPSGDTRGVRYVLREVPISGRHISCWFLDVGDWPVLLWRLAARPNAKPEPRGRGIDKALAEMYATGLGAALTATEVREAQAKLQEAGVPDVTYRYVKPGSIPRYPREEEDDGA